MAFNEMQIADKIWTPKEEDEREETSLRQHEEAYRIRFPDKTSIISVTQSSPAIDCSL